MALIGEETMAANGMRDIARDTAMTTAVSGRAKRQGRARQRPKERETEGKACRIQVQTSFGKILKTVEGTGITTVTQGMTIVAASGTIRG